MTDIPETLLPCPFCGGAAEIERHGTARQSMIVACQHCGARMESGDVSGLTRDLAWNRRAAQAERMARLEEALDGIYIYANDTLSGRVDGPDDRAWQRAAVVEIRNRARKFARAARALSQEGSDA